MKLLSLKLIAFGPFSGVTLDLAAGKQGLHLIYGPNEAGKSSALRALRQLLYGIEERTADSFLHSYTSLRVGATIRHSDGVKLEFIRRKARINSLRDRDDVAVLDASALERFLGGVDAETFKTLFGIDHETLVIGGRQIVEGGGQVGEAIFEASLGIVGLRNVRNGLQADCDALFKAGGKKQKINEAIHEYHGAQAAIKKAQLSSDEWAKHDGTLRAARESREKLERDCQHKSREQNRLSRIRNALPAIAHRKELLAEVDSYRDAVLLPDDFGENSNGALSNRRLAEEQARDARLALEQLDKQIEQCVVPQSLLDQAEKIEELHRRLGEYQKDMKDRPERVLQQRQLEHEAKEILKSLGRAGDLQEVEELRLRADEPIGIQTLGNEHQGLLADCRNAHSAADDQKSKIEKAQIVLAGLQTPADPGELRRIVRQVQHQGDLEEERGDAQQALGRAGKQATIALARLPHWKGSLEALEALPVPSSETLDRFEGGFSDLGNRLQSLRERIEEEEAEAQKLETQVRQLEVSGELPTEQGLRRAREQREAGWQLVRRAWLESREETNAVAAFVANLPPARSLDEAYERSVEQSDQVADRLRREADRVARKSELIGNREKHAAQIAKLVQDRDEIQKRLSHLQEEWADLWQPLGIPPLPPKEMRSWLRQQDSLIQQAKDIHLQRDRVQQLGEKIDGHRGQLRACLHILGEPVEQEEESLAQILHRSQALLDRLESIGRHRLQLQKEIAEREHEFRSAQAKARRAEEELAQWQLKWTEAMKRLGLRSDAPPAAAHTFLDKINLLFQKLDKADDFRRRILGIDRDARDYETEVRGFARLVAPDLDALPLEQVAKEINARLTRARSTQNEREALERDRKKERQALWKAEDALAVAKRKLDAFCQEAHCATPDELLLAAQRSARRKELEKDIRQRDEQILTHSAGATVEELIAQAEQIDPDALGPEIQKLEEDISALRQQISDLDITIGGEQKELARMNGSAEAAEAAEVAENLLAQLQTDVQEYAALRLAAVVLQKGIDRFREKNQGTVLERASRIFSHLTVGSFAGLRIDYDDHGEAILVGIRPESQQIVGVKGMSDGSSDQLYLALRLAALEDWLERHEPIPFIVDDILLNFDNERAVAALTALAELSRRTQVIFFTHHRHLVEMAEQHLDDSILFTHWLPERPTPGLSARALEVVER